MAATGGRAAVGGNNVVSGLLRSPIGGLLVLVSLGLLLGVLLALLPVRP